MLSVQVQKLRFSGAMLDIHASENATPSALVPTIILTWRRLDILNIFAPTLELLA